MIHHITYIIIIALSKLISLFPRVLSIRLAQLLGLCINIIFPKRKKVATIHVEDQGKGIAKNHRKRVFDRFYRIEKSRSKERGGTGLGLAISKHIIEGHKTKIKLKSKVNFGSTFFFNLKLLPKKIKKRQKIAQTLN